MRNRSPSPMLVCYDIREPRRLRRVHRCMLGWGVAVQYSVFFCNLNDVQRQALESDLCQLIDDRCDDVRIYRIKSMAKAEFLGQTPWPDGIAIHD